MRTWLALLGAPSVVLIALTCNYALIPPACAWRNVAPLGGVSGIALLFCCAATLIAWQHWRQVSRLASPNGASLPARPAFLACVATLVGGLSSLSVLAMWIPQWLIPVCG